MITLMEGLPNGVIGFEVTGKIEIEDYRHVVLPALEQAAQTGEVRFLMLIPEFHGMSAGAVWEDLKVAFEHFRAWKRIALVTDVQWMHYMTTAFGWMTPGDVRTFAIKDSQEAVEWVAA